MTTEREPSTSSVRDARLDFYSPEFDPVRALAPDSGAIPPRPRARALDTVRQCRRLLPSSSATTTTTAGTATTTARGLNSFAAQARAKERARKFNEQGEAFRRRESVFDALANSKQATEGPLRVLRDARSQRLRVRIVTRHASGVRGTCDAYVVAFDKFANMVLTDVEERYTVKTKRVVEKTRVNAESGEEKTTVRVAPKLDHRTRRINQVFMRGEQVVSVSITPT
jgi:small nuclear ribonucleoprotein (snRNP)-like protein